MCGPFSSKKALSGMGGARNAPLCPITGSGEDVGTGCHRFGDGENAESDDWYPRFIHLERS